MGHNCRSPSAEWNQDTPHPAECESGIADGSARDACPEGVVEAKDDSPQKDVGKPGANALFGQDGDKVPEEILGKGKAKPDHSTVYDAIQDIIKLVAKANDQHKQRNPLHAFLNQRRTDAHTGQIRDQAPTTKSRYRKVKGEFQEDGEDRCRDGAPEKCKREQWQRLLLVSIEPPNNCDVKHRRDQSPEGRNCDYKHTDQSLC